MHSAGVPSLKRPKTKYLYNLAEGLPCLQASSSEISLLASNYVTRDYILTFGGHGNPNRSASIRMNPKNGGSIIRSCK